MENNDRYSFNSNDLLYKVYLYKKPLIYVTAAAFVVSLIISFLITPLYKSSVVVFPAPSASISQTYIATNTNIKKESVFGEVKEVEQILQVLHSEDLRNKVIQEYNLWKHYNIDSSKTKSPLDKMSKKFKDRISFKRTPYMAVEIEVFDENPDSAAHMANYISGLIDTIMNNMEKARAKDAFRIVKEEYNAKVKQLKNFEDSMSKIMRKGILDFESQSEVMNDAYAQALASGNARGAAAIKQKLDTMAKYGSEYISLRDFLLYEKERLSMLNMRYKEAEVDANQSLTHFYVVEKAKPADKKAKPQRLIIILISTLSTFAFAFVILIFFEFVRDLRRREARDKQILV